MSFKYLDNKEVFVTDGPIVLTNSTTQAMPRCDHEEGDTRLAVHIADALKKELSTCLAHTVDKDVIVILIGRFPYLGGIWYQEKLCFLAHKHCLFQSGWSKIYHIAILQAVILHQVFLEEAKDGLGSLE